MDFSHGAFTEAGRFGIVGIINTLIDFSIFNVLTSKRFHVSKVRANICSTTIAMIFSFFANREAVFQAGTSNPWLQAVLFFAVTAFGLYVIQTGILYLLAERWQWFQQFVVWIIRTTGLNKLMSSEFALKNGSKVAGTVGSLIWSYFLYKYVVFR